MGRTIRAITTALAVAALSACSQGLKFDNDNVVDLNQNAGTAGDADAANPASPAYFQQSVGDRVLFVVDQSTLTSEGRTTLDGQAAWLTTNPDYTAVIEGHADEQGTREYNLALGARRASAVRDYLVSKGISDNRLRTVSFGKERPVEICSEESCYSMNRRAVTIISAGVTG